MEAPDKNLRRPDYVAGATLAVVAVVALFASLALPWWTMRARAPQYGQRVLVIEVSPRAVKGDVFEVDTLGHYVGIRPMARLAQTERRLAPYGLGLAALGLLATPWLRRRWLRLLCVLPSVLMPLVFLADLHHWMSKATSELNPEAPLQLVQNIEPRLVGAYKVGQFEMAAAPGGGLYLAGIVGLLAIGLVLSVPWPPPRLRRASQRALATLAAVLMLLVPMTARAAEHRVSPGQRIGAAVAQAAAGDTVMIAPGVYRERVTVKQKLRIVGEPGAILDGGGAGTVLRIEAGGVEVEGLTVRGSGERYATEDAGIRIQKAAGVHLHDLRIEDALFGVFAAEADRCRFDDLTIVGKPLDATRRGDGIRLWYSSHCRVRRSRVEQSRDVVVWYSQGTVFEHNEVYRSRYGLHYMYSDNNRFAHNRFEDNQVGATIMYSHGVELFENTFSFSNGIAAYGLLVKDADDVFVEKNRFVGNATAVFLDGAPQSRGGRVTLHQNLIARNDVGLALQPSSRGVELWENAFLGNGVQLQVQGGGDASATIASKGGRGNYWSDAVPYDRDGDGVSELPHRLESGYEALSDARPALAFFQGAPAAEAIDLAARLFPLFGTRTKLVDPHPLVAPPGGWVSDPDEDGSRGMLLAASLAMIGSAAGLFAGSRRLLA